MIPAKDMTEAEQIDQIVNERIRERLQMYTRDYDPYDLDHTDLIYPKITVERAIVKRTMTSVFAPYRYRDSVLSPNFWKSLTRDTRNKSPGILRNDILREQMRQTGEQPRPSEEDDEERRQKEAKCRQNQEVRLRLVDKAANLHAYCSMIILFSFYGCTIQQRSNLMIDILRHFCIEYMTLVVTPLLKKLEIEYSALAS